MNENRKIKLATYAVGVAIICLIILGLAGCTSFEELQEGCLTRGENCEAAEAAEARRLYKRQQEELRLQLIDYCAHEYENAVLYCTSNTAKITYPDDCTCATKN